MWDGSTPTSTVTIRIVLGWWVEHRLLRYTKKNEGRGNSSTLGFQNTCRGFFLYLHQKAKFPILRVWGRGRGIGKVCIATSTPTVKKGLRR
jgi:hypothetical protein